MERYNANLPFFSQGLSLKIVWCYVTHHVASRSRKCIFTKIFKTFRSNEKSQKRWPFSNKLVIPENKQVLSYFKFPWIQAVISIKNVFCLYPLTGLTNELLRNTVIFFEELSYIELQKTSNLNKKLSCSQATYVEEFTFQKFFYI